MKIYGFLFHVDEITDISSTSVKVVVLGKSEIISRKQLKVYLVRKSFTASKLPLSFSDTQKFILFALDAKDTEVALIAFNGLLDSLDLKVPEMEQLVELIVEKQTGIDLLKLVLGGRERIKKYPRLAAVVVFHIGMSDLHWLRSYAIGYAYLFGKQLRSYYTERFYHALSDGDIEGSEDVLKFASSLFGKSDAAYKGLLLTKDKVVNMFSAIETRKINTVQKNLDLIRKDPRLGDKLSTDIVRALHRQAESALEDQDSLAAMQLLSLIRLHWRTPTTHEIVLKVLEKSVITQGHFLSDDRVEDFLIAIAIKDEIVREALVAFAEKQVFYFLSQKKVKQSELFFDKLLSFRPDPDPENDLIRVKQALQFNSLGDQKTAKRKLAEINSKITLLDRVKILFSGIYIDLYVIFLIIAVPIGIGALLNKKFAKMREARALEYPGVEGEIPPKRGILSAMISPAKQEYYRCLKVFGLPKDADLKTIKQVYRNAVKEVHPDTGTKNREEEDRFIELSTIYDKLLTLRKELEIEDS